MSSYHAVSKEIKELESTVATVEDQVVAALEARELQYAALLDGQVTKLREQLDELLALQEYYAKKDSLLIPSDNLFRVLFIADRISNDAISDQEAAIKLRQSVLKWCDTNVEREVTGALLVTPTSFFGCLEGEDAAVSELVLSISKDRRCANFSVAQRNRCTSRAFQKGLQIEFLGCSGGEEATDTPAQDSGDAALVTTALEQMKRDRASATVFMPNAAQTVLVSGGNPMFTVPTVDVPYVVVALALDELCGALHRADKYHAAALTFAALAEKHGFSIVDQFGDYTTAMAHSSKKSIIAAVTIAETLSQEVPHAVAVVHMGKLSVVSKPFANAVGPAMLETLALLQFAEDNRRPVVVSELVEGACSKAHHTFYPFTVNGAKYFTMHSIQDRRLEAPAVKMPTVTSWMTRYPENPDGPEVTTAEEEDALKNLHTGNDDIVKGLTTEAELREQFRQIDIGNVGWIGKDAFRTALRTTTKFPLFMHDMARVDRWLEQMNSLGPGRLSFTEFSILHMKLVQQ